MAAFASSFLAPVSSSSFAGDVSTVCAAAAPSSAAPAIITMRESTSSPRMKALQKSTRGLRQTAFAATVKQDNYSQAMDAADDFFAMTVTRKFKEMVNPAGVYDPQCTEGTASYDAWSKREEAVTRNFRATQRSAVEQVHDFHENRKAALMMVGHICNAEETLLLRFPKLAQAYVRGKSEAMRTCDRYATPETIAEAYMANAIDKQNKMRACKYGVYTVSCNEGIAKGRAEEARVAAGSTNYRTNWKTAAQYTGERYNQKAHGRMFAGSCDHEEKQFTKFPSCAAAMKPDTQRY